MTLPMPPQDQISGLQALADVDADLLVLSKDLATEEATLAALRETEKGLRTRKSSLEGDLITLDKQKGEAVQEVRSTTQQIDHSREKMSRSRTERETNAVERELEELRRLMRDREGDLERIHSGGEALRQSLANVDAELAKAAEALGAAEGDKTATVNRLRTELTEKTTSRNALVKALPPVVYRKYETIRQKRGSGLTQTHDGTCNACHIALAPQAFHKLRREPSLEQCPSCNRLIYFAPRVVTEAKVVD